MLRYRVVGLGDERGEAVEQDVVFAYAVLGVFLEEGEHREAVLVLRRDVAEVVYETDEQVAGLERVGVEVSHLAVFVYRLVHAEHLEHRHRQHLLAILSRLVPELLVAKSHVVHDERE